jgi:putative ABC transport system substrate-binding protein
MYKFLFLLNLIWSAFFVYPAFGGEGSKVRVCISQIVEHPALNATRKGVEDALRAAGYIKGDNLDLRFESAQGNPALAHHIAEKFIGLAPDVVVAIATVSAQSFSRAAKDKRIKLIFSSVTDPLAANLVDTLNKPGRNTSGVSNFIPLEPQLKLIKRVLPNLKTLGVLYNPGEINSQILNKKLQALTSAEGIILILQAVTKTADLPQATQKLLGKVDAIFVTNDSTVLSGITNVIQLATKHKKPVFVSDTDVVSQGAIAALGPNQYELGVQTGKMVVRILQGANIDGQKVEFPTNQELYLNLKAAASIGLEFPPDLLKEATKIYPQEKK